MVDEETLNAFDSRIRPFIECLVREEREKVILTDENFNITDPFSGQTSTCELNESSIDRFKLQIPYAQQTLTWEIIFDLENAKEPPDFIFDNDDNDFMPELENINSLVCWDWERKDSLVALITELLDCYRDHQLELVSQNESLQRHFASLMAARPDHLQVKVNKSKSSLGTTNILGKLDIDFSSLPQYPEKINPGRDSAVLYVCIPFPEATSIQTQLYLSPAVEKALGNSTVLRIPQFSKGQLLGEYFQTIQQLLKHHKDIILESLEKRREYIAEFYTLFEGSVLEHDSQNYSKIFMLLEWNDFFFTFTVEIPSRFPLDSPSYVIRSVYHQKGGQPYVEKFSDIPWSPRWSSAEGAKRAKDFVLEKIRNFQKTSVTNSDKF